MSLAERLTDAVILPLGGRDWRLVITYGVLLDCQEATGADMLTSIEAFVQPSAKVLQALLWAMLRRSEPLITAQEVGAMVTPRKLGAIRQAVSKAFLVSMPEPPPKKPTGKISDLLAKSMGWAQTAAFARLELGLSDDEFLSMTPRFFHELREVSVARMRREELLVGRICEVIVNFSQHKLKKPAEAADWIMHKAPEDEPLDLGEKMLRELEKYERCH